MTPGIVYALDLAVRSGFAFGARGEKPQLGFIQLKQPKEFRDVAFTNMLAHMDKVLREIKPALVVKERWWGLGAAVSSGANTGANVYMHVGLHSIVEGMCRRYGVRWEDCAPSTVRKHFVDRGTGKREDMKALVLDRCHLLGWLPKDPLHPLYNDDNAADAAAIYDWASHTLMRTVGGRPLTMFEA